MKYRRPKSDTQLTKQEKTELMRDYVEFYKKQYAVDPATLNHKISREAFADITNAIGFLLLEQSARLANMHGPTSEFLKDNPLPLSMRDLLPPEIRTFCLALNALKQWVSAEQQAIDRLILGGRAREICRAATSSCLVTGQSLDRQSLNLHHPVRDGRPPLPLSKEGHAKIERQNSSTTDEQENCVNQDDSVETILLKIKHEGRRSWVQLRNGCLDLAGLPVIHTTERIGANSKSFARKATKTTGLNYEQLLQWLEENGK